MSSFREFHCHLVCCLLTVYIYYSIKSFNCAWIRQLFMLFITYTERPKGMVYHNSIYACFFKLFTAISSAIDPRIPASLCLHN